MAMEEFGRHGCAGVSVAAVARRARNSKPLIYSYFGLLRLQGRPVPRLRPPCRRPPGGLGGRRPVA
ncbi:helix-turn-helix domain-containing protein [Streptomyces curacoi]|uniref:helix-turn-helix domain-containing protein n=1 Tax=Streptomyces curacoi TaxID=146536 RepID=UPI00099E99D4